MFSEWSEPLAFCCSIVGFPGSPVGGFCMPLASVLAGLDAVAEVPFVQWSPEKSRGLASGAEVAYNIKHGTPIEEAGPLGLRHPFA